MKYIKVDTVPERKTGPRHDLQDLIKSFMEDETVKQAKIEVGPGEYKKKEYAYKSLWVACIVSQRNVKCVKRGDEIFLIKKI